jgi:hypothetical protein
VQLIPRCIGFETVGRTPTQTLKDRGGMKRDRISEDLLEIAE